MTVIYARPERNLLDLRRVEAVSLSETKENGSDDNGRGFAGGTS